jgi:hypothetical protein
MRLFHDLSGDVVPLPTGEELHIKTPIAAALSKMEAQRSSAVTIGQPIVTSVGATRRTLINTFMDEGNDTTDLLNAIARTNADEQQKELATVMVLRVSRERDVAGEIY